VATLFSTQIPALTDAADGTDSYSMGTYFTPAVNGTVSAIRWYFPATAQPGGVAIKANLFRNSDQAKLGGADASFATPGTPGAWNQVSLTTPVSVVAGVTYCATIRTPLRYVASSSSTTPASPFPLTNGDLSAASGAGRFTSGVSGNVDFPSTNFSNGCYFVDVVFTPSASGTPFTKDYSILARVLNTFTKDTSLLARVLNTFTKDYALQARVLNGFTKDVVLQARVLNSFTKDYDLLARVVATFTKDYTILANVASGTGFTKDYALLANVRNTFVKDYDVLARVLGTWQVDYFLPSRVLNDFAKDVVLQARVLNGFSKDYDLQARVRNGFIKDVVLLANVLADTSFVKTYLLLANVREAWLVDYVLRARVLSELPPAPLLADAVARLEDLVVASLAAEHVTGSVR
jgi:hypothetical protein